MRAVGGWDPKVGARADFSLAFVLDTLLRVLADRVQLARLLFSFLSCVVDHSMHIISICDTQHSANLVRTFGNQIGPT